MQNSACIMVILGIDPGLVKTGWGIIQSNGYDNISYIACGIIKTNINNDLYNRLGEIYHAVCDLINVYSPAEAAIERVFVNTNPESSQKLIMARTSSILAIHNSGLSIHQYSANQVKKNVTGKGHATKDHVKMMLERILNINLENTKSDATDALAIALSHVNLFNL